MNTRKEFISGVAALASAGLVPVFAREDPPELAAAKKWFHEAQFGMMCCFGLYSVLGGEWKGRRMPNPLLGEWVQQYFRIPVAEYEKVAAAFNPIYFNADEWMKLAADAGMKYLVFTAKFHDGFAMYRSKVSKFNVVDATPFKRDVVGELAEACRKYGVKLGFYYSHDLDWHERGGGGFTFGKTWCGGAAYWTNNWDFPGAGRKEFDEYFEAKAKPQVEELLTQYGDVGVLWFDIGRTPSEKQCTEMYNLVHRLQPGCLVNSRLGRGPYDYRSAGDNYIPKKHPVNTLYESPCTFNDTWGYKAHDQNWKSLARIRKMRDHLKGLGANFLLNVGPDHLGRIPAPCVDVLRGLAQNAG